ncbi:universal stress protein [Aeromicrobium sp. 9AM]|uniref:universal stress protein n=1 Tax=Aeromicrobium sp. 9AM TaxID=2653126 RepID=UPI0012F2E3FF|nr:universal stress protein [Aeromicrobium sp. 9AM]VXC12212.1 conserved hypothetical protein [Aeromicrobium sp. 9AM]
MNLPDQVPPIVVGIQHEQPALLRYAHSWAERWNAPLRVVHSNSFLDVASELYSTADDGASVRDRAQDVIDDARNYLAELGSVPLEFSINDGPATAVLEMESKHASAVIVGSDDVTTLRRLVGAGVARHVALHSFAPVFVVPHGARVKEIRDVVLEIDENNIADGPIRFAFDTAARSGARLRVMHVVPRTAYLADPVEHGVRLTQLVETWHPRYPHVAVSPSMVCGDADDEAVIASTSAQVMIVGRPNEPHHGQLFGLHVAEEIVRRAQCPVVVVPAEYQP